MTTPTQCNENHFFVLKIKKSSNRHSRTFSKMVGFDFTTHMSSDRSLFSKYEMFYACTVKIRENKIAKGAGRDS